MGSSTAVFTPITPSWALYLRRNVPREVTWDSAFRGSVQNLRISNVARYYSGSPPPARWFAVDSDTVVLYRLDDGGGTGNDAANTGLDATLSTPSLWLANVPCLDP